MLEHDTSHTAPLGVLTAGWQEQSLRRLVAALDGLPALVGFVRGAEHVLAFISASFQEKIAGGRDVVGLTVDEAFPGVRAQGFIDLLDRVRSTGEPHLGNEVRLLIPDVPEMFLDLTYQPVRDAEGVVDGVLVHAVDVTAAVRLREHQLERERREEQLRLEAALDQTFAHRALHDSLTGLPNRVLFLDRVDQVLRRRDRTDRGAAVLFADLDAFKPVNDAAGHQVGDEVLRQVSQVIGGALREGDTAARIGGDEFAVCCDALSAPEDAVRVAQRLIEAVSRPVVVDGVEYLVGVSIGIAYVTGTDAETSTTLLDEADTAMYRAKEGGRGRYAVFDEPMRLAARRRTEIVAELHHAVDRDELRLVYQPAVALRSGRVVGVEALLRWDHPRLGLLTPEQFLPVAEDTTLVLGLGAWTIDRAVRQIARWTAARSSSVLGEEAAVPVTSVNISPRQLADPGLPALVRDALQRHGVRPPQLALELTELALTADPDRSRAMLAELRELGVRLIIDDFGAGHSSFAHLTRFAVDAVKIDVSGVRDISAHPQDTAVVRAITALAGSLRILTIATGVANEQQCAALQSYRCPVAQGSLFAEPLPGDRLAAWLAERH